MSKELKKNLEIINQHLDFLRETYKVKNIGIFGSTARGQQTKKSDVDILVELSEPVGLFKFVELEQYLSKVLKKKVDLGTKNALKPTIKKQILKEVTYV